MKHILDWPPLEALDAVMAASRLGSFSAAAVELDLTHGAISRRVAVVERWAGFRLFDRHGRGVRLSLEGERLISTIEQSFALLDRGRKSAGTSSDIETVLVSVVPSFARLWLLPNVSKLEGEPQDLRVEMEIDHRFAMLSASRIAIRYGAGNWPGTVATPLFDEELVPVASRRLCCDSAATLTPAGLLEFPLIHDTSEGLWRTWFSAHDMTYERREQDRVFNDYDMTLLAASQGLGFALLRSPYGVEECERLGLSIISGHRVSSRLRYHVVSRPGLRNPATDRLIMRIVGTAKS